MTTYTPPVRGEPVEPRKPHTHPSTSSGRTAFKEIYEPKQQSIFDNKPLKH